MQIAMKKILKQGTLVLALLTVAGIRAYTQDVRLNLYTLYNFEDKFDSYYSAGEYYNGTLKDGLLWGGGIEKTFQGNGIELIYMRQDTHAPTTYQLGGLTAPKHTDLNAEMNYILLGFNRYVSQHESKFSGYGGLMAGVGIASLTNPDNGNSDSYTKFSWGLRLGGEIAVSTSVSVKLQAQYVSMVQAMSGGIYVGTGGAGAGVSGYSSIGQFGLGGGLAFKFGGKSAH
jgi:hypothetical protein